MAELTKKERAGLPNRAFAYVDSQGHRPRADPRRSACPERARQVRSRRVRRRRRRGAGAWPVRGRAVRPPGQAVDMMDSVGWEQPLVASEPIRSMEGFNRGSHCERGEPRGSREFEKDVRPNRSPYAGGARKQRFSRPPRLRGDRCVDTPARFRPPLDRHPRPARRGGCRRRPKGPGPAASPAALRRSRRELPRLGLGHVLKLPGV